MWHGLTHSLTESLTHSHVQAHFPRNLRIICDIAYKIVIPFGTALTALPLKVKRSIKV